MNAISLTQLFEAICHADDRCNADTACYQQVVIRRLIQSKVVPRAANFQRHAFGDRLMDKGRTASAASSLRTATLSSWPLCKMPHNEYLRT